MPRRTLRVAAVIGPLLIILAVADQFLAGAPRARERGAGKIDLAPAEWNVEVAPGKTATYTVYVYARGGRLDKVDCKFEEGPAWLTANPVHLEDIESGKAKKLVLTAAPPADAVKPRLGAGNTFKFKLAVWDPDADAGRRTGARVGAKPKGVKYVTGTVTVKKPARSAGAPVTWRIDPEYRGRMRPVAGHVTAFALNVYHTGGAYPLRGVRLVKSASAPAWIRLSSTDLGDIPVGQSRQVMVALNPPADLLPQAFNAQVTISCANDRSELKAGGGMPSNPVYRYLNMDGTTCQTFSVTPVRWDPVVTMDRASGGGVITRQDFRLNCRTPLGGFGVSRCIWRGLPFLGASTLDGINAVDIAAGTVNSGARVFTLAVTPKFDSQPGEYPYEFNVYSAQGAENFVVRGKVTLRRPSIVLSPPEGTAYQKQLEVGAVADAAWQLTAQGGTVEGVTISRESGPDWVTCAGAGGTFGTGVNYGNLAAGQSRTFNVHIAPPLATRAGRYEFRYRLNQVWPAVYAPSIIGYVTIPQPKAEVSVPFPASPQVTVLPGGAATEWTCTVKAAQGTLRGCALDMANGPAWITVDPPTLGDITPGQSRTFRVIAAAPFVSAQAGGRFEVRLRFANGEPAEILKSGYYSIRPAAAQVAGTSWSQDVYRGATAARAVTVTASGGALKCTALDKAAGPAWIAASAPTLVGSTLASGASATVTLTAAPGITVTPGAYPYKFIARFDGDAAGDVTICEGTLTVKAAALAASPTAWSATAVYGAAMSRDFTITASGVAVADAQVARDSGPGWLNLALLKNGATVSSLGTIPAGASGYGFRLSTATLGFMTPGSFPYQYRVTGTGVEPVTVSGTLTVPQAVPRLSQGTWNPTVSRSGSTYVDIQVFADGYALANARASKVSGPMRLVVTGLNGVTVVPGSPATFRIAVNMDSPSAGSFPFTARVTTDNGSPAAMDVTGTITITN